MCKLDFELTFFNVVRIQYSCSTRCAVTDNGFGSYYQNSQSFFNFFLFFFILRRKNEFQTRFGYFVSFFGSKERYLKRRWICRIQPVTHLRDICALSSEFHMNSKELKRLETLILLRMMGEVQKGER